MNELQLKLCDIQGRLFELSGKNGYGSEKFIKYFMLSETATRLDEKYNRMQWAGEEYLLEEIVAENTDKIKKDEEVYGNEILYWIGYLYRYWHYYTSETSAKIYAQANAQTMKRNYMIFHTMAPEIAIEDLKEIHKQSL